MSYLPPEETSTAAIQLYTSNDTNTGIVPVEGAILPFVIPPDTPSETVISASITGLNVPVTAGQRLVLIFKVLDAPWEEYAIEGHVSAGVAISQNQIETFFWILGSRSKEED